MQTFHVMLIYSGPVALCPVSVLISYKAVFDGVFLPHKQAVMDCLLVCPCPIS